MLRNYTISQEKVGLVTYSTYYSSMRTFLRKRSLPPESACGFEPIYLMIPVTAARPMGIKIQPRRL